MTHVTIYTTDERYSANGDGTWWDTTGIDIVPQEVVDQHLESNPRVGLMVVETEE